METCLSGEGELGNKGVGELGVPFAIPSRVVIGDHIPDAIRNGIANAIDFTTAMSSGKRSAKPTHP